jgi:hypothetical protein
LLLKTQPKEMKRGEQDVKLTGTTKHEGRKGARNKKIQKEQIHLLQGSFLKQITLKQHVHTKHTMIFFLCTVHYGVHILKKQRYGAQLSTSLQNGLNRP